MLERVPPSHYGFGVPIKASMGLKGLRTGGLFPTLRGGTEGLETAQAL